MVSDTLCTPNYNNHFSIMPRASSESRELSEMLYTSDYNNQFSHGCYRRHFAHLNITFLPREIKKKRYYLYYTHRRKHWISGREGVIVFLCFYLFIIQFIIYIIIANKNDNNNILIWCILFCFHPTKSYYDGLLYWDLKECILLCCL